MFGQGFIRELKQVCPAFDIASVSLDYIANSIVAIAAAPDIGVVSVAAFEIVIFCTTIKCIVSVISVDTVIAPVAIDDVIHCIAALERFGVIRSIGGLCQNINLVIRQNGSILKFRIIQTVQLVRIPILQRQGFSCLRLQQGHWQIRSISGYRHPRLSAGERQHRLRHNSHIS